MARRRRSRRVVAEHIQERRRRRRPLHSRRTATVALGKSRFTVLREHAFTMMPQGNILGMYQVMVENIFKNKYREMGRRCAVLRTEIHEGVQQQVSELGQDFHTEREIRKLVNWALRELRREGRLCPAGPGRFRLTRRRLVAAAATMTPAAATRGASVAPPAGNADADLEAAEDRRLAWLRKRDRHRVRTRMEERYRRRQRRRSGGGGGATGTVASPSSCSDLLSSTTDLLSSTTTGTVSQMSLTSLASLQSVELGLPEPPEQPEPPEEPEPPPEQPASGGHAESAQAQ